MSGRGWLVVGALLGCKAAVTEPPRTVVTPVVVTEPAVWQPLAAVVPAKLVAPVERTAAACDAAAEAAGAAGVLDVAEYWRAEAQALEPSPAREQAWRGSRAEAGVAGQPVETLTPELARALRVAVEGHAWAEVLALTERGLASGSHHELYLWAGDALWQLGRDVEARRMWSRARVVLRRAESVRVRESVRGPVSGLAWTDAGLLFERRDAYADGHWVELWGDRVERPWRRWYRGHPVVRALAGAEVAEVNSDRVTVYDAASLTLLGSSDAHASLVSQVVGAAAAPVFATASTSGEVRVWSARPALATVRELRELSGEPLVALDEAGTRVAIGWKDRAFTLVEVGTGGARELPISGKEGWDTLAFQDLRTLIAADGYGDITRVHLGEQDVRMAVRLLESTPDRRLVAAAGSGEIAAFQVKRGVLESCDRYMTVCRERATDFGVAVFDWWDRRRVKLEGEARWSPDGRRLAVAQRESVQVQGPGEEDSAWVVVPRMYAEIAGASLDGGAVAVEGAHGVVVWDARTGFRRLQREGRMFFGFSPDGGRVALVGRERDGVEVHALAGGAPTKIEAGPVVLRFSPDGGRVAIGGYQRLGVWDAASGARLWQDDVRGGVDGLEFTAGEVFYASGGWVMVRDAAGERAPRRVWRVGSTRGWTVSPGGAELVFCAADERGEEGLTLIDVRTRRIGGTFERACGPRFVDADTVYYAHGSLAGALNVRTGLRRSAGGVTERSDETGATNGRVVVGRHWSGASTIRGREGQALAEVRAREGGGWFVVSAAGAVDGDPGAIAGLDAEVRRGLDVQRYPAMLAWDGVHVPGLLPRVMAGELVAPPVPR